MPGSHPEYSAEPSGHDVLQQSVIGSFVSYIVNHAQVSDTFAFVCLYAALKVLGLLSGLGARSAHRSAVWERVLDVMSLNVG